MRSMKHRQVVKRPPRRRPATSSPRAAEGVTGRLVTHRDGYGFVIPDKPLPNVQGDIFIGQHSMGSAMHGDRVLVAGLRHHGSGRAEGRIERVLERAQSTIVGRFHHGSRFNYVVPYDDRIVSQIIIFKSRELPELNLPPAQELDGAVVDVEITRFPTATQDATGRVIEVLGREGEFGIDVGIIIRKHHLRHRFPHELQREATAISHDVLSEEIRKRQDFRYLPIVTIDGETARDFDDAVYVERLPNGNYQLQVHIADVSYYVRPGSALDREARLRGTSVYFPDRAVPMLPEELSNGICSLKPGEDRLVMSVVMEINGEGKVVGSSFAQGVIRSAQRMTYTAVNAVLENDTATRLQYVHLASNFELMRELALILNRKRRQRGSIDFDLPEPEIALDEFGVMVAITRSERNIAHRIIEEFMLVANETVAAHLEQLGLDSLHRVHEEPDPKKVIDFEEIASSFGYTLGVGPLPVKSFSVGRSGGRDGRSRGRGRADKVSIPAGDIDISPRHYQRLTDKIAGKPEERILSYLMLRSLKQARYSEESLGHFALATPMYTHFTSPIRRYPDLIVHRVLRFSLEKQHKPPTNHAKETAKPSKRSARKKLIAAPAGPLSIVELQEIGLECSESERRAQEAERELIEWKKARFMADKVGDEFDALIISVSKFGFFIELSDLFVEGLVPIETLTDDWYAYREGQQELVGERNRRRFRIGDKLRVRLDRVGEMGGKMQFSVAD
ncbi:MAG: VacB/RNase II family 3'-5' exoribonuclease [Acidobacteria bacterium]|nr:VacB/RNase II family 3'-5' exoribonuclease [Acidobacteriota bacterium]